MVGQMSQHVDGEVWKVDDIILLKNKRVEAIYPYTQTDTKLVFSEQEVPKDIEMTVSKLQAGLKLKPYNAVTKFAVRFYEDRRIYRGKPGETQVIFDDGIHTIIEDDKLPYCMWQDTTGHTPSEYIFPLERGIMYVGNGAFIGELLQINGDRVVLVNGSERISFQIDDLLQLKPDMIVRSVNTGRFFKYQAGMPISHLVGSKAIVVGDIVESECRLWMAVANSTIAVDTARIINVDYVHRLIDDPNIVQLNNELGFNLKTNEYTIFEGRSEKIDRVDLIKFISNLEDSDEVEEQKFTQDQLIELIRTSNTRDLRDTAVKRLLHDYGSKG